MPTRFSSIKFDRLSKIVKEKCPKNFEEVEDFARRGEHLRGGKGFIGPDGTGGGVPPSEANGRASHEAMRARGSAAGVIQGMIGKSFTFEDVLGEVLERRTEVLLQKEPQFDVELDDEARAAAPPPADPPAPGTSPPADPPAPPTEDTPPADPPGDPDEELEDDPREPERQQIGAALANRWDTGGLHDRLKDLADTLSAHGRASLAIVVPTGRLTERDVEDAAAAGGTRKELVYQTPDGRAPTAEDALDAVFVDVLGPNVATSVVDPSTRGVGVVVSFEKTKDELTGDDVAAVCQVAFLDGDQSVLRIVTASTDTESRFDLGGLMLMREAAQRRPFISPSMLSQQKALNTASTVLRMVNDRTGFQRHVLTNAMPPTVTMNRKNPTTGEIEEVDVQVGLTVNPGDFAIVQGAEVEDNDPDHAVEVDGQQDTEAPVRDVKTPGVHTLPPGDPSALLKEMDQRVVGILRRARQLYALLTGEAAVSGDSRIAALYDLMNDAGALKATIDGMGKWLLETMWAVACHLAATPERRLDTLGLKVVFDCRITLPMPTSSQISAITSLVEKSIWAPETAMAATGIDDTTAEEDRIQRAQERRRPESDRLIAERTRVNLAADKRALEGETAPPDEATRKAIEDAAGGAA